MSTSKSESGQAPQAAFREVDSGDSVIRALALHCYAPKQDAKMRGHGLVRRFLRSQRMLSSRFDRAFLPAEYRIDGNSCFDTEFVAPFLHPRATVVDVGGGKRPALSLERKVAFELRVIGFDISRSELEAAPRGSYDATICADITRFVGEENADLAICAALLEHVPDVDKALRGIASMLKPGGLALIFIPCRNTLFARLNLLLPQNFKKKLLNWLFPESASKVLGFRAYYDRCIPHQIELLAQRNGLVPEKERLYFYTGYFEVFTPLHVLWRFWQVAFLSLVNSNAAESFSIALRKSTHAI
jgi:2-polyprenyl-3-methyl-5-hydroxy-6-metoxy-1,4-benzoquinol methylase